MATNSYPAVGTGGLTDAQWSTMYGGRDGIIEDNVGTACKLTPNNGTNMASISAGKVSVNGYVLDITTAHDLYCAPVGSGSVTYTIAAQYDPALNVADGGGARSSLGPCRLIITSSALDYTAGKSNKVLYTITRNASQVLSAAATVDYRSWIGPVIEVDRYRGLGLEPIPRGALLIQSGLGEYSVRTVNEAGTALEWQSLTSPLELAFPAPGSLVAAGFPARMHKFAGSMVALRGTLKRSSGANLSTGADVTLGTLPAGWRPWGTQRWPCIGGGGPAGEQLVVVIIGVTGVVAMRDPQYPCPWVDLSGVTFRAEN